MLPAIDLHAHSDRSDGTESPAQVMVAAREAGLDVVALTDHDTWDGWEEAAAAVGRTGVALVRGAEISTSAGGISVHLLSYLHDPDARGLGAAVRRARDSRLGRARRMVQRIARDFDLTWEEVEARLEPGGTVGRPHIADALVARGYVTDRTTAFAEILSSRGPYYVPYDAPDVVAAVELVRRAGGVPVMAHPRAASRGRVVQDEVIEELAAAGLAGLEVDHRDHDEGARAQLRDLARSLGLFVTGSSDYHGAGKPNRLGEHLTDPAVLEQIESEGYLPVVRP
ncbi:PHP domain-containing protein [uncultured Georgenia sp.]|uniref:PHP domain-containing protein n=1 Tax=uncultured Georgenia sp. TaxID=378209 RepID=UPI00261B183D|nr:PHP domain-containing protein [uncultured Georgenia sp.]HLV05263.1 PHP domain-containing protein [Actinomycetaceae bacterium]